MALDKRTQGKLLNAVAVAILILFAIGALSVFGIGKAAFWFAVPSPTATTKGLVIHHQKGRSFGKTSKERDQCWVSYEVEGKTYTNYSAGCGWSGVGDEVDVIYQTTAPKNSAVDSHWFVNSFGILGLLFLIGAFHLIRKMRNAPIDNSPSELVQPSIPDI